MDDVKRSYQIEPNICSRCGRVIAQGQTYYDAHANKFCYDCNEAIKAERRERNAERRRLERIGRANRLYEEGCRPSEIAQMMRIKVREVYELLAEGEAKDE